MATKKTSQSPKTSHTSPEQEKAEAPKDHHYEQQIINGIILPVEYEVWRDGVFKRKGYSVAGDEPAPPCPSPNSDCPVWHKRRLEKISGRAVFIDAIGCREDDDREMIACKYLHSYISDEEISDLPDEQQVKLEMGGKIPGDDWKTTWITFDQAADSKKLLDLSAYAFPVRTSSSRALSDYLTDCYDTSAMLCRQKTLVRRAGCHEIKTAHENLYGWLVGKDWIGPCADRVMAYPSDDRPAKDLTTKGSLESWLDFARKQCDKAWIVRFFLGASFASPLLRFISQRTFFLHHYSQSGGGKSSLAYFAQSPWGHPIRSTLSLNRATQNALTEVFKYISDLPVTFDELQGKEADMSDFIMQACTETHKARVRQEGGLVASEAKAWKAIIRTTGEQTLAGADKGDLGGQANRVLEVRHPGLDETHATEIWNWVSACEDYGHAGRHFLTKLSSIVNNSEKKQQIVTRYELMKDELAEKLDSSRTSAIVRHLSAIALGEYLMLFWVFDMLRDEAFRTALLDATRIGQSFLRTRDAGGSLVDHGLDLLAQHRHAFANQYADATTELGQSKLSSHGTRSSAPVVGVFNAGKGGKEIWYLPAAIDPYLRQQFNAPPHRFWEDLAERGILLREKDRLKRARQIQGIFQAKVYVLDADKMASHAPSTVEEDLTDITVPEQWYSFEDEERDWSQPTEWNDAWSLEE